jgi:hypothetical protein
MWEADSLVVETKGHTLTVPLDSVTKLDVVRGQKSRAGAGALIGLFVGGVAGAFIGSASEKDCAQGLFSGLCSGFSGMATAGGATAGILGGLVAWALIGRLIKTDRWQEVPLDRLRVSLGPQRDGRFGLGGSVRF